jgi:hypothetical protein
MIFLYFNEVEYGNEKIRQFKTTLFWIGTAAVPELHFIVDPRPNPRIDEIFGTSVSLFQFFVTGRYSIRI